MSTVYFLGTVLPLYPRVSCGEIPRAILEDDGGRMVTMRIRIVESVVTVECQIDPFDEARDLSYLLVRAVDLSRTAVNLIAFASGSGLTVHLHSFQSSDGTIGPLRTITTRVTQYCTAYRLGSENDEDIRLICAMAFEDRGLHIALNDLIESITFPHCAAVNCARAVEAIRNIIAPGKRHNGWPIMHAALNTSEAYVQFITSLSEAPRHGDHTHIPERLVMEAIARSWIIMDRFLVFRKRGNQSLPLEEFKLLTEIESS